MSYSTRNISPKRQINEGLAELVDESAEHDAAMAAEASALDVAEAEMRSKAINDIVMGVNPEFGTHMNLTEWEYMLDAVQATPEQRRLFEETRQLQRAAENDSTLTLSDLLGEEDDLNYDRYPEGDYNPGRP